MDNGQIVTGFDDSCIVFCEECGDCLDCHGEDPCYFTDDGEHVPPADYQLLAVKRE